MIVIKTKEEIEKMRNSGKILRLVLDMIKEKIEPGVRTIELDRLAERRIYELGGVPAFKGYRGYPNALCISINDEVIHGIPSDRVIQEGDVVKIDGGVILNGYYSDAAFTKIAGTPKSDTDVKLVEVVEKAFFEGIAAIHVGAHLYDIGYNIQKFVESNGFSVLRDYTGHGIGRNLHEDPSVPNYGKPGTGISLKAGMTLAIEPMITAGNYRVYVDKNGWTVKTVDGSNSAHFEHTVAIFEDHVELLTE
ncbi:type I methionyl aminopeptidase [Caldisericum exile]|uniref:Methionine aminopeptidase n=1 Tax=Caldisericum exile (strain DSM 21853 / NBRC 104410 / AZM16c01) TaxID=511051 RepID=A0A7U6JEZ3_CALEA|nr:type I methionyl aminopeptidase [Caldisericum exile]BAL81246.1 methionine aminopeptidase [Caldisericum exile AZM16c01]